MLYLIATPIGNLGDLSFRAVNAMKECDYLLCEDTRHSRILLNHYELTDKKLISFHKFNERKKEVDVLEDLQNGLKVGLLSDAGSPGIADPGEELVRKCRELSIPVFAIPGPCAIIAALTSSGCPTEPFQFIGFLPPKEGRMTRALEEALNYVGTTVCYETPHRITKSLKVLATLAPEREVVVMRELTKKFESFYRGTPAALLERWKEHGPKGEIVLLIPPSENSSK